MQIIDVTNESAARTLVKSLAKGRGWKVIKCRDFGACRVHWAAPNPIDAPEATSENVGDIADEWDNDLTLVPKRHLEAKAVGLDLTVPVKNTKIRVVPDPALNKLARDVESGLQQP